MWCVCRGYAYSIGLTYEDVYSIRTILCSESGSMSSEESITQLKESHEKQKALEKEVARLKAELDSLRESITDGMDGVAGEEGQQRAEGTNHKAIQEAVDALGLPSVAVTMSMAALGHEATPEAAIEWALEHMSTIEAAVESPKASLSASAPVSSGCTIGRDVLIYAS